MMEGVQESPSQESPSMANATLRYQEEERRKKNLEPELVSSNYLKPLT
ncbi:MAG: hypothetical protein HEQ27_07770 [Dolichospermum sp. JUN01]|jgi:hypothetical protein|nr:hypothetical protein [Dolichospermum sp. JUN01]QSV63897.1 MAG: hypothetical protein HEQ26_15190 [Dolichospermum sp. DL01]